MLFKECSFKKLIRSGRIFKQQLRVAFQRENTRFTAASFFHCNEIALIIHFIKIKNNQICVAPAGIQHLFYSPGHEIVITVQKSDVFALCRIDSVVARRTESAVNRSDNPYQLRVFFAVFFQNLS